MWTTLFHTASNESRDLRTKNQRSIFGWFLGKRLLLLYATAVFRGFAKSRAFILFFLLVELNQYTRVILKFRHAMIKVMMSSSVSGGGYGLWKEVEGGIMISLLLFPSMATLGISTLEEDGHWFVCWSCLHLHKVCLCVLTLWACLCRINKTIMDLLLKLAPRPLNQLSITESWLGWPGGKTTGDLVQ